VWLVGGVLWLLAVPPVWATIAFTISNPSGNEEIIADIQVSGLTGTSCSESRCYLQGMLTAPDTTRYFGFTADNSGGWYEYIGSPEVEYIKSNFFYFEPIEGSWSGKLKIKNNPTDLDYSGPGQYWLKVRRYSGKSTSYAGESNTLTVDLVSTAPTSTPTPTASPTPTPTANPTVKPSVTPVPTVKPTASAQVLAATVAETPTPPTPKATGGAAATPKPKKAGSNEWLWLVMVGGGGMALAALFPFLRKWYYDHSWLKTVLRGGDRSSFGQD
jgi:hypothetical protein